MSNILDRVAQSRRQFRPQTVSEFFALQLARKLRDSQALPHYLNLVRRHSQESLLVAWVSANGKSGGTIAERFNAEIKTFISRGANEQS